MQKTHDIRWYPAMILVGSTKKQSYTNVEEPPVPYLEGDSYNTLSLLFFPFLKTWKFFCSSVSEYGKQK